MTRRVDAFVRADVLQWARSTAGMTREAVADRFGVPETRVAAWETGVERPSVPQLRELARFYRRPLAAFFLSQPPADPPPIRDFRIAPANRGEHSPALRVELRAARYRRLVALELVPERSAPLTDLAISRRESPENVAAKIRKRVPILLETQFTWRDGAQALSHWISALESLGILVFQTSGVPVGEVRGFSLSDEPLPIVVLNGSDHPHGRLFTLLHELTHVALRQGGLCDLREGTSRTVQPLEVFCNAVAAAVLVPRQSLMGHASVQAAGPTSRWSEDEIARLASRYSVSREVILRRLLTIGKTSRAFYREMRAVLLAQYERMRKPPARWGPSPATLVVRNNGRAFTGLVLGALRAEQIQPTEAARFLRTNHRIILDLQPLPASRT